MFTGNEFPWTKFYDSDLREILKYMKEFENKLNSYDSIIEELKKALTGIEGMEKRITVLEEATKDLGDIRKNINDLTKALEDTNNTILANYSSLYALISILSKNIDSIQSELDGWKDYIDNHDNALMADYNKKFYEVYVTIYKLFNGLADRLVKLAEIIKDIDTKAYNPWERIARRKESLQTNLNYAYSDLADNVPLAEEYSELGLTADEYSDYEMRARDYSLFGRKILHILWVYSPVYGFRQEVSNVLTSIVNWICGTMNADEYANLDLDADGYTNLEITADEYYKYGTQQGYLQLGKNGITASQYSTIGI